MNKSFIGIGVFGAASAYFGLLAAYGLNVGDEGGTVYLFTRILNGQRPYIDFISGYTPAYFYWHAAVLHLFNNNLIAIRFCLALVNTASVLLLYTVSRSFVRLRFAVLPPLGYLVLLPVFPSTWCTFNVPYPSWYAVVLWLLGVHALVQWWRTGVSVWLMLTGVLAGLCFSFKPNTGLFNFAADALCVAYLCDPRAQRIGKRAGDRMLWWALLAGICGGIAVVFHAYLWRWEGFIFVAPIVALTAAWAVGSPDDPLQSPTSGNRGSLAWATVSLFTGFAAVTLPWLLYFWWHLGWSRFLHEVLFVDTGYEQFFYLAYRDFGWRDLVMAGSIAGLALGALAVGAGVLSQRSAGIVFSAAALGSAGWLLLAAPMPEGFQRAVAARVQDAAFALALLIHWIMIAQVRVRRPCDQPTGRPPVAIAVVSALFMYLSAYPRSDFLHLIFSAPMTLVLGALLLSQLLDRWKQAVSPRFAVWLDGLAVAGICSLLIIVAWPQLELCSQVVGHYVHPGSAGDQLVQLPLQRAGVLIRPSAAAEPITDLAPLVEYLRRQPDPDGLFTFPNLDLIGFLAGRNTPARIGYFYAGWPDHVIEAEVVEALAARPPRFAVVRERNSLFFNDAPAYYFLLRTFVASHYQPWGRVGAYDVFLRRGAEAGPLPGSAPDKPVASSGACTGLSAAQLRQAVRFCLQRGGTAAARDIIQQVRDSESADAAEEVAAIWASGGLAPPRLPSSAGLLALRAIGDAGDARAAVALLAAAQPDNPAQRDAFATALFKIALRELFERFEFAPAVDRGADTNHRYGDSSELHHWLVSSDVDPRLRFFASWALTAANPEGVTANPQLVQDLQHMSQSSDARLRLGALAALVHLGVNTPVLDQLFYSLPSNSSLLPGLVLTWSRAHQDLATPALSRLIEAGDPAQRELAAFIAGVLRWPALLPALQVAAEAPAARVRLASVWALGRIGNAATTATLRTALSDPDLLVRRFADGALRQLHEEPG